MNPTPTGNPSLDQRPITLRAWLAADLLRVLNDLRYGQHGRLGGAVREDLDYHAGLLHVRLRRVTGAHMATHDTDTDTDTDRDCQP